jgi:hypothetical protein
MILDRKLASDYLYYLPELIAHSPRPASVADITEVQKLRLRLPT